ncbi:hypothetical protein [Spirosoma panaciterrae]|uniref:hypothetical protein n=1 Tax=Spirosoma panaciterrae TaxID=496058 RepID=UPI0003808DCF|nr:hypothetical protein [Spirosoma panaciterrae]
MILTENTYEKDGITYLKTEYFKWLVRSELLVDGSAGGLVLGPTRRQGGIILLSATNDGDVYITGQTENWELLINHYAYIEHQKELLELSRHTAIDETFFMGYLIPSHIHTIDARAKDINGESVTPFIYQDTHQIGTMPKVPAKKHLTYLDTLNRASWLKNRVEKQAIDQFKTTLIITKYRDISHN